MSDKKYNQCGYVGLKNLGNTCFLNSCLQALSNTPELNKLLDNKTKLHNNSDGIILDEWNELRQLIWSNDGVISPNKFVRSVQNVAKEKNRDIFTGWSQNDISEFLLFMMECIHNSISRSVTVNINGKKENNVDMLAVKCYTHLKETYAREFSEINEMFYGIQVTELLSIDKSIKHSVKPEQYFIIDLPLPSKPDINIYDCFDLYTTEEKMEGENAWFNDKTNAKEDIIKRIRFWNLPDILVITFNRFSFDGKTKRNDNVLFPLDDLNLSAYVCGYKPNSYKYELYAICNHSGNVFMGHYTAFIKNYTNNWFLFNDETISKVKNTKTVITPMAYCLFYRKKIT
jgi:ubiquitin carboxyl-terminal hydrolase 8